MIDTHAHVGRISVSLKPLTVETLVSTMDRCGIEKTVILPIENPEELDFYSTTEYVLSECGKFPERLIPFCNADPRRGMPGWNPRPIIEGYKNRGCKGFGECLQGLPIDDPRSGKIYEACGELELPVVIDIRYEYINYDKPGLPGFEKVLSQHSNTVFIAHGPAWWSEISAEVDPKVGYPKGKVKPGGRADTLLGEYENLYADLSAGSGYNAITRDPEFGVEFLERHKEELLFATDYLHEGQELPMVDHIKKVNISRKAFRAITKENAKKLLHI